MSQHEETPEDKNVAKQSKIESLKKKTNLQLIEAVRLDAQMIEMRFSDFFSNENNVYTKLA
jgi:hypothetical protein